MRDEHVFLLYISSSLLNKRLMHVYGLTLMSFFKNHDVELRDMSPESFIFNGVITGHHF